MGCGASAGGAIALQDSTPPKKPSSTPRKRSAGYATPGATPSGMTPGGGKTPSGAVAGGRGGEQGKRAVTVASLWDASESDAAVELPSFNWKKPAVRRPRKLAWLGACIVSVYDTGRDVVVSVYSQPSCRTWRFLLSPPILHSVLAAYRPDLLQSDSRKKLMSFLLTCVGVSGSCAADARPLMIGLRAHKQDEFMRRSAKLGDDYVILTAFTLSDGFLEMRVYRPVDCATSSVLLSPAEQARIASLSSSPPSPPSLLDSDSEAARIVRVARLLPRLRLREPFQLDTHRGKPFALSSSSLRFRRCLKLGDTYAIVTATIADAAASAVAFTAYDTRSSRQLALTVAVGALRAALAAAHAGKRSEEERESSGEEGEEEDESEEKKRESGEKVSGRESASGDDDTVHGDTHADSQLLQLLLDAMELLVIERRDDGSRALCLGDGTPQAELCASAKIGSSYYILSTADTPGLHDLNVIAYEPHGCKTLSGLWTDERVRAVLGDAADDYLDSRRHRHLLRRLAAHVRVERGLMLL